MQYRVDERSGNRLSQLGFGCMRFPGSFGRVDMEKTEQLILDAIKGGVNYFDTAYLYPGSEEALGKILQKHGLREKVFIATKLPQAMCETAADFDRYFETQKQRLQTETIDYYFMHNITEFGQWQRLKALGIEGWLAAKKQSGEIRQAGFSYHGPFDEFGPLLDAYDWDFVQLQYNYINVHYQAGQAGVKMAAERGLPVFVMEPLLGGKLATGLPKEAESLFAAAKPGSTPAEWALNWLWNEPEVTLLLSGMNTPAQLEENLRLAGAAKPGMLAEGELATVAAAQGIFNKSYKIQCTGCNYCMPCPKKINIPACFAAYNASYAVGWMTGVNQYVTSVGGMAEQPHYASDCVQCGKCEGHCPQGIEIRSGLKAVRRRLQVPGLKAILPVAVKYMRK